MSDQDNTTNAPAATAAPATTTPPAKSAMAPDFRDLVQSGLQNLGQKLEQAQHKPAETTPPAETQKPAEPVKAPDRRFKLTPSKPEDAQKATEKAQEAAPKPVEASVDPLEAIEPDKGVSEAAKANFAKLREAYKSTKAERAAYQKQLDEMKAQIEATKKASVTAPTADYEALKSEHQKVLDRLAQVDYQNHPEFVSKYAAPKQAALAEVQEVLNYNDKKADLVSIISKPLKEFNAALSEITKGMNEGDKTAVFTAMRNAHKLENASQEALKNAKGNMETLSQRSAYTTKAEWEAAWNENGLSEWGKPADIPADAPEPVKSFIAKCNDGKDSIRATAERYAFAGLSQRDTATVAQKAAVADHLIGKVLPATEEMLGHLYNELAARDKELASLKSARSPGVPVGSVTPAAARARSTAYSRAGDSLPDMTQTIENIMRGAKQ